MDSYNPLTIFSIFDKVLIMRKLIKILFTGFVILIFNTSSLFPIEQTGKNNTLTREKRFFSLENGMKVFLEHNDKIPLVNIAFAVNVGSRNDTVESSGIAHLLEHLILLGSTKSINNNDIIYKIIKKYGFYFNAHTLPDVTTLELSTEKKYWKEGLKLMEEKLFNLSFTSAELDREKNVILEELSKIQDDPEKLGFQLVFQNIFKEHPYQLPVGGNPEIIKNLKMEQVQNFYKKYFSATNCSLSIVGDFNFEHIEKYIRSTFGKFKKSEFLVSKIADAPKLSKKINIKREMDIEMAHLFLAYSAPFKNSSDKVAIDVLSQILSKGMSPILYYSLNRGRQLVHQVRMVYNSLEHGGVVIIHVKLKKKNIKQTKNKLISILHNLKKFKFSKKDYLYNQRQNIPDFLEIARTMMRLSYNEFLEQGINLARSYAKYILALKKDKKSNYTEQLNSISSKKLRKAVSVYFSGKHYIAISIIPEKKKGLNL